MKAPASVGLLLVCLAAHRAILAINIDTTQPIIRSTTFRDEHSYFGYSVALHQVVIGASNMQSALESTRILVSAPNGSHPSPGAVHNTGLIFTCPVTPGQECAGLVGNGMGNDRRLFDMDGNAAREEKQGQFLGVSMQSNGGIFIVCAHRYLDLVNLFDEGSPSTPVPVGRCLFSGRSLRNFLSYTPCRRTNTFLYHCMAGESTALAEAEGSDVGVGVSTPGAGVIRLPNNRFSYAFRGGMYRLDSEGSSTRRRGGAVYGYLGYAMTTGHVMSQEREDFILSAPRRNFYKGSLEIIMNSPDLTVIFQNVLGGSQMGEYYGFSLVAADLTGDGLDEVLVGAPMYRTPASQESGRVFVYSNTGGSLQFHAHLTGDAEPYSRFGYAMVSLGDTNGDGLEDVAISAPFGAGTGKVYIYLGSAATVISSTPAQVISGSDLSVASPLLSLRGFGTSLASGVDVDANGYNDLLIGSFESQRVFLLRARPVAHVTTSILAAPVIVNVDMRNCLSQQSNNTHSCFMVTACATYTGEGISNTLELKYTLIAERTREMGGFQRRLFFDTPGLPNTYQTTVTARAGQEACANANVYVTNNLIDRFNPFLVELRLEPCQLPPSPSSEEEEPRDFSGVPVLVTTGTSMVQVETFKDCNGDVCYPDLALQYLRTTYVSTVVGVVPTMLTVGLVSSLTIWMMAANTGDDAFQATITFTLPTTLLNFQRAEANGRLVVCSSQVLSPRLTQYECLVGNPLKSGQERGVGVVLQPSSGLTGAEDLIGLEFSLSSVNPEISIDDLVNNNVSTTIIVDARADISVGPGTVIPEQLSYASTVPDGEIVNVTQLGPELTVSFGVRNAGPSMVPNTQLVITWPLRGTATGEFYYLYPTAIAGSGASITCNMTYINPEGTESTFLLPLDDNFQDESGGSTRSENGRRKRRRRGMKLHVPQGPRRKRQAEDQTTGRQEETSITVSCEQVSSEVVCVPITCNILQLSRGRRAQVDITAYIDERHFGGRQETFTIIATAEVSITGADFIEQPRVPEGQPDSSTVEIPVIPAVLTHSEGSSGGVPAWVIVVSILAGIVFIALLGGVLWGLGFFSRKKHQEVKTKREALALFKDQ